MKKIILGALLCSFQGIMFPMNVSAQLVDTWIDNYIATARIRDRNIKSSSPRLESLQMGVAIEDESNVLDLDSWGDNRAWLGASKFKQIKVDTAFGDQEYSDGSKPMSYAGFGAYGRFGNFELEGMFRSKETEYTSYTRTNEILGIGVGWGHSFGGLLIGLHSNSNLHYRKYSDVIMGVYKSTYQFVGAAMAVKLGQSAIGVTVDRVNFDEYLGSKYGAQVVIDSNRFKVGFRASIMPLEKDWQSGVNNYLRTEEWKEFGVRFLWTPSKLPINLGAEYSNHHTNYKTTRNGAEYSNSSSIIDVITVGTTLKLMKNSLIGVEAKRINWDNDVIIQYSTVGMEIFPMKKLVLRGSFQHSCAKEDGEQDEKTGTYAVGLGYNFSKSFSVDISGRYIKDINTITYTRNDIHLMLTSRF